MLVKIMIKMFFIIVEMIIVRIIETKEMIILVTIVTIVISLYGPNLDGWL